jgi:uncharacterized protein (UPF0332 family)
MHNELEALINYRKQQSFDTINEVQFQIDNGYLAIAVNRIYYGMFFLLLALSLKRGFKTSKHQQLIGWFNKEFIKTGIIDNKYGRIIHQAFEDRSDGDYGIFVEFTKDEVLHKFEDMKDFIQSVQSLI